MLLPKPEELKESFNKETKEKNETIAKCIEKLLENVNIVDFMRQGKKELLKPGGTIQKEIRMTSAEIAEAEIEIVDLIQPIIKLFDDMGYAASTSETTSVGFKLNISIKEGYLDQKPR
ncbi:MAG: hypothetical protein WC788_05870 [Candidatus Paceibacterota bacterium]|jgi:hypothetical protein